MGPQNNEPILDDNSPASDFFNVVVDGEMKGTGHDPSQVVKEMFAPPSELVIIPRDQWSARLKEQTANKSRTSDILRLAGIPSMDQGPNGYCWGHSIVGAVQAVRAIQNQPYVPLSAYMVCAIIKGGRNEGGWCGLSAKFVRENGVCSQALWPQGDRNTSRDTPEVRADAALHKTTEEWADLTKAVYDQNLAFDVNATCFLTNVPAAGDFNHWSHSVLLCDLVETAAMDYRAPNGKQAMKYAKEMFDRLMELCGYGDALFGVRFRNSWSDSYGDKGFGVLNGTKAITDGAIALRSTGISPN